MLMSQGAISAGEIGWPNCGVCASAGAATTSAVPSVNRLSIDIARLSLFVDAPARDGIVVVVAAEAALVAKRYTCRLHHAGVVGGTALQDRRTAIPLPGGAEAHGRLRQVRVLHCGQCPALAAIGRDLDLADPTIAGPGQPGDFVESGSLQQEPRRRARYHRFH